MYFYSLNFTIECNFNFHTHKLKGRRFSFLSKAEYIVYPIFVYVLLIVIAFEGDIYFVLPKCTPHYKSTEIRHSLRVSRVTLALSTSFPVVVGHRAPSVSFIHEKIIHEHR